MLAYKIDVVETLKEAGYHTTRLHKEKLLNESATDHPEGGRRVHGGYDRFTVYHDPGNGGHDS